MEETERTERPELQHDQRFTLRDERGVFVFLRWRGEAVVCVSPGGGFRTPHFSRIETVLPPVS